MENVPWSGTGLDNEMCQNWQLISFPPIMSLTEAGFLVGFNGIPTIDTYTVGFPLQFSVSFHLKSPPQH